MRMGPAVNRPFEVLGTLRSFPYRLQGREKLQELFNKFESVIWHTRFTGFLYDAVPLLTAKSTLICTLRLEVL